MAQDYSPSLVTKKLVFCGDAAMKSAAGPATLLYDKVNNNNGTMYNGTCCTFDGTNDYIDCGTALGTDFGDNYTGGFTVSLWFKLDSAYGGLFSISSFSSSYGAMNFYVSGYELIFRLASDVSTKVPMSDTTSWHHVVGTYDGSTIKKIYLDGALGDSDSYTADLDLDGLKTIIGGFYSSTYCVDGKIADVRVYSAALSAANVKELYDDSKVIIPTKNDASGGFVTQTNLKGWWPLTEGTGDIVYDGSGNGNSGTFENDTVSSTAQTGCPQLVEGYNRPMLFDGINDYVNCGTDSSLLDLSGTITVAAWVYWAGSTGEEVIYSVGNGETQGTLIQTRSATTLRMMHNTGSVYYGFDAGTGWSAGTWHHVALTFTGSRLYGYIDGSSFANTASTTTLARSSSNPAKIGTASWTTGRFWPGIINEVLVYNTALSLAQVQALAATGPNGEPLPPDAANMVNNASGGTVTTSDGWTIHTFTSSGTFTPSFSTDVEVLVVAGGGGGGTHSGGGGGAGGLLYYGLESPKTPNGSAVSVVSGVSYTITVGAGGAGGYADTTWAPPYHQNVGVNGVNSSIVGGAVSLTAIGGGGGGNPGNGVVGVAGGSGGGGGRIYAGGAGTAGQGYAGSNGFHYGGSVTPQFPGAGGGGAGGTGTAGSNTDGGDGGVGLQYSISGTATYYAGGGGGNIQGGSGSGGAGGNGGGGAGSAQHVGGGYGFNATTNTGGGGGGTQYYATPATGRYGNGGSGIVIIRYRTKSFLETGNIKGYWRNDGDVTWADRSGNGNTGTVNGSPDALLFKQGINGSASTSTGRDNQGFPLKFKNVGAVGFNGSSDYIQPSQSLSGPLVSTTGALDFWINFVDSDSNRGLYYLYDAAYADYFILRGGGSGNLTILAESGNSSILSNDTDLSSYMGQWINLVYTQDGTTIRVYVNGVEIDSVASTVWTGHLSTTPVCKIGYSVWSSNYLNAGLGAINVYDRALTQTEITKNFAAKANRFQVPRSIVTDGLVLWLDAENPGSYPGSGNIVYDLSGNDNDFTHYTSGSASAPTISEGAFSFNGSTQYLNIDSGIFTLNQPYTLYAFVKPTNLSSDDQSFPLFNSYNGGTAGFWHHYDDNGTVQWRNSGSTGTLSPGHELSNGSWACTAITWDGSTITVYKNGVMINYMSAGGHSFSPEGRIGMLAYRSTSNDYNYNGLIANQLLYTRALSATEIQQNFRVQRERFGV